MFFYFFLVPLFMCCQFLNILHRTKMLLFLYRVANILWIGIDFMWSGNYSSTYISSHANHVPWLKHIDKDAAINVLSDYAFPKLFQTPYIWPNGRIWNDNSGFQDERLTLLLFLYPAGTTQTLKYSILYKQKVLKTEFLVHIYSKLIQGWTQRYTIYIFSGTLEIC